MGFFGRYDKFFFGFFLVFFLVIRSRVKWWFVWVRYFRVVSFLFVIFEEKGGDVYMGYFSREVEVISGF